MVVLAKSNAPNPIRLDCPIQDKASRRSKWNLVVGRHAAEKRDELAPPHAHPSAKDHTKNRFKGSARPITGCGAADAAGSYLRMSAFLGKAVIGWDIPKYQVVTQAGSSKESILRGERNCSFFAPVGRNELEESKTFGGTRIPVRMNSSRRHKQTIAAAQGDRRFAILLPDTSTRQDIECNRRRMEMPRIDCARLIFRVPNNNVLAACISQFGFKKRSVSNTRPSLDNDGYGPGQIQSTNYYEDC